jgi:hypothetical protein
MVGSILIEYSRDLANGAKRLEWPALVEAGDRRVKRPCSTYY